MKYTYFSSTKSGKYLLRSQFWYNRRSCAFLAQSKPLWCVLSAPVGNLINKLDKLTWYWTDKDNKLQSHNHVLDTTDKLINSHYDEMWFPIPDDRGYYYLNRDNMTTHENFYQCVDDIMSRDLITNPFGLLGYTGALGSEKMMTRMANNQPNLIPPDILDKVRQRKNIVPYKENIEHMAYNFFAGNGRPQSEQETTVMLNNARKFQQIIPKVLDSYKIPYEMFSLDTGDYAKTFDLDNVLPRDSSDKIFTRNEWNQDVDRQVKDYMDKYA